MKILVARGPGPSGAHADHLPHRAAWTFPLAEVSTFGPTRTSCEPRCLVGVQKFVQTDVGLVYRFGGER